MSGQRLIIEDQKPPSGLFATIGLGVIDIDEGTGLGIPLGVTAVSPGHRVLATFNFLDLGLLQGSSGDQRYRRLYDTNFGQEFCYDTQSGRFVAFGRCAGDTNLLRSMSADVSILPIESLIVGSKPGVLHVGMGWRRSDPATAYGTIGMFFPSTTGTSASVKLSMGRRYIALAFSWGINYRRTRSLF